MEQTKFLQIIEANMAQQQAYHRLLGQVFIHHKDCEECLATMKSILEMIAHNIEQLDQVLPEAQQAQPVVNNQSSVDITPPAPYDSID